MKQIWNNIKDWLSHNWTCSHRKVVEEAVIGMPYDFGFLLRLEREKIREIRDYFISSNIVDHTNDIKWMNICIKLLDILIENSTDVDPKTLNYKNIKRFIKPKMDVDWEDVLNYYDTFPDDYRYAKAWYLYFEIRKNYTGNWWD